MRATGLPARIVYATLATPAALLGGFYLGLATLTRAVPWVQGIRQPEPPGWAEFVGAILIAGALGFVALCYTLTLPGARMRRRRGRPLRMVLGAVLVLAAAVTSDLEGVPLRYTGALIVCLSVTLTFTWIRYGLLDGSAPHRPSPEPFRPSTPGRAS